MSNYRGHTQFNLLLALPLLLGGIYYFQHPPRALMLTFAGVFAYCTLFMTPDMDLASSIRLFSVRGFFTFPFRSYSWFFGHRGLSHNLVLGSLTRIGWLALWGWGISLILYKTLPTKATLLKFYGANRPFVLYSLAAICLADWCHLLLDHKRFKRFS